MPPRSANRKASARAKKLTPKSKRRDVESSTLADDNSLVSELENKDQELALSEETGTQLEDVSTEPKVQEAEEAAQPEFSDKEIKREIEVLDAKYMLIEGLESGGEDMVVASTVVEMEVKEEVVEEARNTDTVMEDHANVNAMDVVEDHGVAEERETMEDVRNEGGDGQSDNVNTEHVAEKGETATEEDGVDGVVDVGNDACQLDIVPVAEQNTAEEGTAAAAAQINDAKALGNNNNVLIVNEGSNGEGEGEESGDDGEDNEDGEEDNEENEDGEDPSVFMHEPLTDRKKQKDLEIFIGRLDKGAVEDDLIKVFGKFGEVITARIARNPSTKKSKGFAFIRFATVEQAKNALSELKDGIEVRGKHVKISASQDNDTLYVGNICKQWTKEHVLGTLKDYGIVHIEEIHLPDDPKNEGRIKGFAFLEFSTHSDAMAAFQRLRKPDAVFGHDRSAKVAFTQTPMHPNEDVISQVKTIYVEGLTNAWNEERVKDICKQYGEIMKVKLSRNLGTKRKDFGFVIFSSRESALACVEGINNAQIGEGEVKVKASMAKPHSKGRLQKQGFRGGFKVKSKVSPSKKESASAKQAGSSKMKGRAKSKRARRKAKVVAEEKGKALPELKIVEGGKPNKPQNVTEGQSVEAPSKLERTNRKRKNLPSKVESRRNGGTEQVHSKRPSKKLRGNMQERQSKNFRNPKRDPHIRKGQEYGTDSATYKNPYAPGYAASTAYYQGHARGAISGSKRRYTDMEPHAGYLEPVAGKQRRPYSGYLEPAAGRQGQPHALYIEPSFGTPSQPHAGYIEPAVGTQGRSHASYLTIWTQGQSHGGYVEPAVGTQGQSHVRYLQPAVGIHAHDPYDPRAGHNGQQGGGSAYGGGSALPPSYVPNYTNYAGYEGGASVGGYYQSRGAYPPRRAYH